jgi:hypothetical protein
MRDTFCAPPRRTQLPVARVRRGGAIILVMLTAAGLAALALSAIFMSSSSTLMTKYYDKERDFRYASEQAIQLGKSRLLKDTSLHLPDSGYSQLMTNAQLMDASGYPVPHVRVNLYAGLTGNTTGQFGQFASLVAEAHDTLGNTRYVRRLELEVQNFARFAMFTNQFSGGLCYSTGEFIRGVGMSNQIWNSCGTPTYYDTISAASTVGGGSPTYVHGNKSHVPIIPFPTVSRLSNLPSYAAAGNYSFTTAAKGSRLEFVTVNMNPSGTIDTTETDANEGFFRVFNDTAGTSAAEGINRSRAYYSDSVAGWSVYNNQCGDWHTIGSGATARVAFFPFAVHNQTWFKSGESGATPAITQPFAIDTIHGTPTAAQRAAIMAHTTPRQARCYQAGDPHLVAVERNTAGGAYAAADTTKGGEDSTFSAKTRNGYWAQWPGAVPSGLTPAATCGMQSIGNTENCPPGINAAEEPYLFPLYRVYNPNTKGVIYFNGDVAMSGYLRGIVTVYSGGTVWFTDDLYYASDPSVTVCANELGVIATQDIWIADNAINSPQNATAPASPTGPANSVFMSDNKDFYLDGVTIALGATAGHGTFGVENYNTHAINMTTCNGTPVGRGCIKQAGGVIEQYISATYNGAGSGFAENRSVDQCLLKQSPPYFPVTGKYIDNRYFEMDPARYNIDTLYARLQAN